LLKTRLRYLKNSSWLYRR